MCNSCININQRRWDPTRTNVLRNTFSNAMKRRFRELTSVIRTSVDTNDCFGLRETASPALNQLTPLPNKAFQFRTSEEKIVLFMEWLREQAELGILDIRTINQIGTSLEQPWTNVYIESEF